MLQRQEHQKGTQKMASIPPLLWRFYTRKEHKKGLKKWPAFPLFAGGFTRARSTKRGRKKNGQHFPCFHGVCGLICGSFRGPRSRRHPPPNPALTSGTRSCCFPCSGLNQRGRGYLSSSVGFLVDSPPSWREYRIKCARRPKSCRRLFRTRSLNLTG